MKKLYIVTRANLPAGLQLAQSCHALQSFNDQHPELAQQWEGNLVVLAVPGVMELGSLTAELCRARHKMACFHEPDLGGELTAFAVSDTAAQSLSQLRLALRPSRVAA